MRSSVQLQLLLLILSLRAALAGSGFDHSWQPTLLTVQPWLRAARPELQLQCLQRLLSWVQEAGGNLYHQQVNRRAPPLCSCSTDSCATGSTCVLTHCPCRCLETVRIFSHGQGTITPARPLAAALEIVAHIPTAAIDTGACTELARLCIAANYPTLARDAIVNLESAGAHLSTQQYACLVEGALSLLAAPVQGYAVHLMQFSNVASC